MLKLEGGSEQRKESCGRKKGPAVVAVLAVFALIESAFVYTKLHETDHAEKKELTMEDLKEETITLSDYSEVYQPGYEDLAYEENTCTKGRRRSGRFDQRGDECSAASGFTDGTYRASKEGRDTDGVGKSSLCNL